ncbi:MAG: glycerate-2-kinase family protein, partial [Paracoccaceae bacterium]|nr:glycerate-2-kinase family protein [Paracoccaceae bacterium]
MTETLRQTARSLFDAALRAADPAPALRRALAANPLSRPGPGGGWLLVAAGKAAVAMAAEAMTHLTDAPLRALVVTNSENRRDLPGARVLVAGHPVPDANGAAAAADVSALLAAAGPQDRVVALISGGGSALLPAPASGLTLEDKAAVNRMLLANGFEITQMNAVRQQLSTLKGGGMLRLAAPAPVAAFILSDVIGDDLRVIASGPTVAPIGTRDSARALLQTGGVWDQVPA